MKKSDEIAEGQKWLKRQGPGPTLVMAVANGFAHMLKWLLDEQGVDANARGAHGTALHAAADVGSLKATDLLLAHGADLDALDQYAMTPLMVACHGEGKRFAKVALRLIEAGADLHYVRQADEESALTFALRTAEPEVVEALRAAGAAG